MDELDVNRSSYWNSCVDFMEPAREHTMVTGISGLVCFILLMLLLTFEIFYICRYKTTFLQRLFFYLTMVVTLVDVIHTMYLGYSVQLSEESCYNLTLALGIILFYAGIAEILAITFINVAFLKAMFKYHFEKSLRSSILPQHRLNRYCTTKLVEVAAVFTIFVGPLSVVVVGILMPRVWIYFTGLLTDNYSLTFAVFYGTKTYGLLLSLISTVVMIAWFCSLRRKSLSTKKKKLVCREFGLIAGILVTYLVLMLLVAILAFYPGPYDALLPIVHSCMPFIFLVYICTHINNSRKITQVQLDKVKTVPPTAPPSTRVSLPSDTASQALNFLSPSTAEPTENTPLIN